VKCRIPQTIRTQISNIEKKAFRKNLRRILVAASAWVLNSRRRWPGTGEKQ
jgi:hypothetical protein